jgi:hypothetical protein
VLAWFVLAGCATPPAAPADQPPVFTVTAERDGNTLTVGFEGETAVIDVRSERGIGQGMVELASGTMPPKIVVRLHLKGLEGFRLSYDETVITAQVPSVGRVTIFQSLVSPKGAESAIAVDSPFWLENRIVSDQPGPAIPLNQGYFELTLPQDFFNTGQRAFSLQWVDFYR